MCIYAIRSRGGIMPLMVSNRILYARGLLNKYKEPCIPDYAHQLESLTKLQAHYANITEVQLLQ